MVNAVLVLVVVLVPVAALLVSSYMVIQKFFHFQDQMDLHAPLLDRCGAEPSETNGGASC